MVFSLYHSFCFPRGMELGRVISMYICSPVTVWLHYGSKRLLAIYVVRLCLCITGHES